MRNKYTLGHLVRAIESVDYNFYDELIDNGHITEEEFEYIFDKVHNSELKSCDAPWSDLSKPLVDYLNALYISNPCDEVLLPENKNNKKYLLLC